MASYSKAVKKRIKVLKEEIEKYDTEVSGICASVETILRESANNIEAQADRTDRFQDMMNELSMVMTQKEFIEQRINELEIIRDVCKEPGT